MLGKVENWYLSYALWLARRVILILILTLLAFVVLVWTRETSLGVQEVPTASPAAQMSTSSSADAALLNAQLEQVQRTDERLLQTVYWAMGTLAAVAVLLVGFSWFTNVRLADKDRAQLRNELDTALSAKITEAETRLEKGLQKLESKALDLVSSELQKAEQEHQARFNQLQTEVALTQLGLLESAARSASALGNLNEVLETAATMVAIGKNHSSLEFSVSRGLELMQSALTQGARPSIDLVARINGAIGDLAAQFATDRNIVSDLLTQARQNMNVESEWEG